MAKIDENQRVPNQSGAILSLTGRPTHEASANAVSQSVLSTSQLTDVQSLTNRNISNEPSRIRQIISSPVTQHIIASTKTITVFFAVFLVGVSMWLGSMVFAWWVVQTLPIMAVIGLCIVGLILVLILKCLTSFQPRDRS